MAMCIAITREKWEEGGDRRRSGMVRVMGERHDRRIQFSANTSLESAAARRSHGCLYGGHGTRNMLRWGSVPCRLPSPPRPSSPT